MPFPNIDPLIETFLEPTRIFLFGKKFPTLTYDPALMEGPEATREFETYTVPAPVEGAQPDLPMPPGRVEQALRQAEDDGIFARIYGFSFEGHYYKLPRPLLFLVRGEGRFASPERTDAGVRVFDTRLTGVEGKDWWFGNDIRVWAVDKHDIAVCLDLEIGSYDQVLLQSMTAGQDEGMFRSPSSRSAVSARGSAAAFRSAFVGPHQDR